MIIFQLLFYTSLVIFLTILISKKMLTASIKGLYPAVCYSVIELHRLRDRKEFSVVNLQDYFSDHEQAFELHNLNRDERGDEPNHYVD
jgi:hypothetical protein